MPPSAVNLDSPLVQQTKTEIRSIATEIARLAQAKIPPKEFYEGFLTRLVVAMGATGGAIWRLDRTSPVTSEDSESTASFELLSGHRMPDALLAGNIPSPAHRRILDCVVVEGQALLVPPASVKVDAARPINPLSDALIIVPIRVQDTIDVLVEVIQRPSGGPAAQRGYLRFVAQMADLLTDFLRQHKLRELVLRQGFVERVDVCLNDIASAPDIVSRRSAAIENLRRLFDGEQALLLSHAKQTKVVAIAGTGSFDPRSELITNAAKVGLQLQQGTLAPTTSLPRIRVLDARDRRNGENQRAGSATVERLCDQLGCRRIVAIELGHEGQFSALVCYADCERSFEEQLLGNVDSLSKLSVSVGTLLEQSGNQYPRLRLFDLFAAARDGSHAGMRRIVFRRIALGVMLVALAFAPVPQRVSSNATLHPSSKQNYFAPMPATVSRVWVHEGQEVQTGDIILTLDSPSLNSQVLRLQAEREQVNEFAADLRDTVGKRNGLSPASIVELELKLHNYENQLAAIDDELRQRCSDLESLTIRARSAGRVSSWGLENRLLGRPVVADDLLVSTYDPNSAWHFELALPERRMGLVARSLQSPQGSTKVNFLLSSFPDQVLVGELQHLGTQSVSSAVSFQLEQSERSVMARVEVDAELLPVKKDGVFATASIDCGRTPLIWLVIRDATCEVFSRIRMLW
jgi:hypothetical protein